jgi:hypothetical protein
VPPTFAQDRPVLQVPVATVPEPQQGWPSAPQALHVMPPSTPAPQAPPGWHRLPSQQAAPTAPQFMHTSGPVVGLAQPSPVLQVWLAQQFWPLAPQGSQVEPPSPAWQDSPELLQVFVPPQQAWPIPPQGIHAAGVPAPGGLMQPRPELHVMLAQQAWPLAPQGSQVLPPSPAWQERPARHWFAGVPPPMQQA